MRKTLEPDDLMCIVDNREQLPLDVSPLRSQRGTLATGDYSLLGLEDHIAVERKSLQDLIGCVGVERERFDREIQRLRGYECRAVVVEGTWTELCAGGWRSKVPPSAAVGSVLGWMALGIPFLFVHSHEAAGAAVSRLLYITARRKWRELTTFRESLKIVVESA